MPETVKTEAPASYEGHLIISVTSSQGFAPIKNATITISYTGDPDTALSTLTTNESGQTDTIVLPAPSISYSTEPSSQQPYSEYNIQIDADGYESVLITGTEILPDVTAIQPVSMTPVELENPIGEDEEDIIIPAHVLFGDYPAKIPEDEVKPTDESGEIVLSRVVIPEYIVVHDGTPQNSSAKNYYVRYTDYIKNVVSSEIYATWPESTIYANTLAIMSFTLNRVYTEWYRNQGYDFTITSSTAYDQQWVYGRNIYDNISRIVDSIFSNYLSRPGVKQPIFTSYCDGNRTTCKGLSQWGSKYLGDQGYTPIEIIRYYYGSDMYINSTSYISGIPASWPGYDLTIGSSGQKVLQLQEQLNRIAQNYPAIPTISEDGIFGSATANAVRSFQSIFGLPANGIVDYPTWYKISQIYVAVSRISEP